MLRGYILFAMMMVVLKAMAADDATSGLWKGFSNPQDSARTKVWWFHGQTETTREGITADLEAMKAIGLGGATLFDGNVDINYRLTVAGTKNRKVKTSNYSDRLLYSYETPTPLFGDIGEAVIGEDGVCYVDLDDIFTETIADKVEYQVFLQKEGEGDCWVGEKTPRYFVIHGTPNLKVAWELKAKQKGYELERLEPSDNGLDEYEKDTIKEQEELLYGNY